MSNRVSDRDSVGLGFRSKPPTDEARDSEREMPELPEVEAARRAIEEHCAGKRICECSVADDPKVIDGVSASELEVTLVGKTIVAALRKGKNLWLRLDSPPFPTFHFGRYPLLVGSHLFDELLSCSFVFCGSRNDGCYLYQRRRCN